MNNGVFVLLYDSDSLAIYLKNDIYGTLMTPINEQINPRSRHFQVLADYGCVREGTHVFFFLKRRIIYAGQITGSDRYGAFLLNSPQNPFKTKTFPSVYWDESNRYTPTSVKGIFKVGERQEERNQPYLIHFEDKLGIKGKSISSDSFYFKLGIFQYPLPSNSIQNMSFCTLTPGEVEILLSLLKCSNRNEELAYSGPNVVLVGNPVQFSPNLGICNLQSEYDNFVNEAHLEFTIVSNSEIIQELIPFNPNDAICRQVPISPLKPENMDRADICIYSENNLINNGTIPNTIIELKLGRANQAAINQVIRYLEWIKQIVSKENFQKITVYLIAPSFTRNLNIGEYNNQINLVSFVE